MLFAYFALDQTDASLIYEELCDHEAMEKTGVPKVQGKVDVVPIGTLILSENKEDVEKFMNFVASDEGTAISAKHEFGTFPPAKYGDV